MNQFSARISILLVTTLLLSGCALLRDFLPIGDSPDIRDERASRALASLNELKNIDAFVRLDNSLLREQVRATLEAQAAASEAFGFSRLSVRFKRQAIALEASVLISNPPGSALEATVSGDVLLAFSGKQLIWLPQFKQLSIAEKDFSFAGKPYATASAELQSGLLGRINTEIADAVMVLGNNAVQINPVPLGRIEVGAKITDFIDVTARNVHELGGVFTVAGSAILIQPSVTSIVLDLEFVPNISTCPADIYVSRATFATEIRSREPVAVARTVDGEGGLSHFFTEISGANRPTAVIHYWFADGQPVAVQELPVEPSYRWRTWSSRTVERATGNLEVIVVEKESGCILHSLSLSADPHTGPDAENGDARARNSFEQLVEEFERRVSGFSILEDKPKVALIEVPNAFLNEVLHASLKDIHINVDFDIGNIAGRQVAAVLQPFPQSDIVCEVRECPPQNECLTGFTQCARHRDTRDCKTCLFRNPLNGRCVNEGVDPICEAARTTQNRTHQAEYESCLNREESEKIDCERLRIQQTRSCEIESKAEKSLCETSRETLGSFAGSGRFASVTGQVRTTGGLRAIFSNFEVEEDLSSMRMSLGFSAALDLDGSISVDPWEALGSLADCMAGWRGAFRAKIVMPLDAGSMIGSMQKAGQALVTYWSGYVLSANVTPSPLEALLVENPELLADCHIGLTVEKVSRAVSGEGGGFFTGRTAFEIQPLPSTIALAPATVGYGAAIYRSVPALSATHVRFDVGQP